MKAVIVDVRGKYAAALSENGEVIRIARGDHSIGQTIELHNTERSGIQAALPKMIRIAGSAAAALVLALGIGAVTAYAIPYGTVTVGAESSIEYTINCFDYVLDVKAGDENGELLLSEMDADQFYHQKIGDAVAAVMEQIDKEDRPETEKAETVIDAETKNEDHTQKLLFELKTSIRDDMGITVSDVHAGSEDAEEGSAQDNRYSQEQGSLQKQENDQDQAADRGQDSVSTQPDNRQEEINSYQRDNDNSFNVMLQDSD